MSKRRRMPPDLGTRRHRYRLPAKPTKHLPGTDGKVDDMHERLLDRRHLHHPGDPQYTEDGLCRVPILEPTNNKIIGFRLMTEREYRQLGRVEDWWKRGKDLHRNRFRGKT